MPATKGEEKVIITSEGVPRGAIDNCSAVVCCNVFFSASAQWCSSLCALRGRSRETRESTHFGLRSFRIVSIRLSSCVVFLTHAHFCH